MAPPRDFLRSHMLLHAFAGEGPVLRSLSDDPSGPKAYEDLSTAKLAFLLD